MSSFFSHPSFRISFVNSRLRAFSENRFVEYLMNLLSLSFDVDFFPRKSSAFSES